MDSGGPVLWENPSTHNIVLVGIISSGIGCASKKPAVSMRVGAYLKWIESVTPGKNRQEGGLVRKSNRIKKLA